MYSLLNFHKRNMAMKPHLIKKQATSTYPKAPLQLPPSHYSSSRVSNHYQHRSALPIFELFTDGIIYWVLFKKVASFAQYYICCISYAHFHCHIAFHCVNVPQFTIHYVVSGYSASFRLILLWILYCDDSSAHLLVNKHVFLLVIYLGVEFGSRICICFSRPCQIVRLMVKFF